MNSSFVDLLLGFALSVVSVGVALIYARRAGVVDIPNDRSSHMIPTPRGGGIAIVGAVVAVVAFGLPPLEERVGVALGILGMALAALTIVGWLDDLGRMPAERRFYVHVGCGGAVALLVATIAPVQGNLEIAWLLWWVFWTIASINIVNFMDGIDGMVAAQGVVYGVFLFALLPGEFPGSRFGLILAAACLGFLVWNWAPAKMFLGDAGSGPLGLLFVIGGALAVERSRAALVFLPLFPLFLDALITLVRRFRKGEKLTHAHRQHLYQRIANGRVGHPLVSLAYALAAAVGAFIAILVKDASAPRITGAIVVYAVAVVVAWVIADARWTSVPVVKK